jgi:hypothetical protein
MPSIRHYCVDESGSGIIFNRKGKIILGEAGCSNHFILGLLDVEEPSKLKKDLDELRATLLADPYFKRVPSFLPRSRKTFLGFHAKDDVPEVRREVFRILLAHKLKFYAVVKRMRSVLENYVNARNQKDPCYRYHPNELYNFTVRVLFKNLVHKHDKYMICFARRYGRDRTKALNREIITARERFSKQWGKKSISKVAVKSRSFHQEAGLQAADYFLWALQRLYERKEERYIQYIWPKVGVVHDIDDKRNKEYGEYYSRKRPLTIAALKVDSEI